MATISPMAGAITALFSLDLMAGRRAGTALAERRGWCAAPALSRRRTPPWEGTGGGPAAGSGTALGRMDEFLW